jgi:hypothetical protein
LTSGREPELEHRALNFLHSREGLGQTQVRQRVARVKLNELSENLDGFLVAILALQASRYLVERRESVARQPELLVELGELRRDVRVLVVEVR